MKTKEFYKKIISIKIPIFLIGFGLWFLFYITFIKDADVLFLRSYLYVYISLIIIVELLIAFLRTIKVINHSNIENRKKVKFNLLILPYIPAILSTFFYFLLKIHGTGIIYKREFITTFAITLFINFFFSAIFNNKIKIFEKIKTNNI